MAKVYLARHSILETRHAIKVLDPAYRANPEVRQRFLDEARIQASQLDHPNIVKVVNIVATPDHAALVLELVDGGNLDGEIATLKQNPAEIRRVMLAVLDAVGHAHSKGIIHRDLKPGNVLLAGSARTPKVTDFGIAKTMGSSTAKKSTHADTRMGTLTYSSPEQFRRAKDVTPRSDVFSLGAMLYEMATGEPAFAGESDYDVMDAIVKGTYAPPEERYPAIDPVIASVIRKAIDPDPAKRFASCEEMAAALRGTPAVHETKPAPAAPAAPPSSAPSPPSAPVPAPAAQAAAAPSAPVPQESSRPVPAEPPASSPSRGKMSWTVGGFVVVAVGAVIALVATQRGDDTAAAPLRDAAPALAVAIDAPVDAPLDASIDAPPDVRVGAPCTGKWRTYNSTTVFDASVTVDENAKRCVALTVETRSGRAMRINECKTAGLKTCPTEGGVLKGQWSCVEEVYSDGSRSMLTGSVTFSCTDNQLSIDITVRSSIPLNGSNTWGRIKDTMTAD